MKYANSLKYMNSFPKASSKSEISTKRALELCMTLGRVNIGMRCICIPSDSAGHAIAVMLESVIKCSGHTVGRLTQIGGFDSRSSVFINGEIAPIEDYNTAVAELKSAVSKNPDQGYTKEETTFALGLLMCKMSGCEFVILEGMSDSEFSLDSICAPYDIIVFPTIYDVENIGDRMKTLCELVKRGTREVVSGNQKSDIYNQISNACAISGVRLYIPVKAQFETQEITSRKVTFSYSGREGFSLKSPSYMLRDCAMTVIESALALRRGGVKMPWNCIAAGLGSAADTVCFDMLALSPLILVDSSAKAEEAAMLLKTADETLGEDTVSGIVVAVPEEAKKVIEAFADKEISRVLTYSATRNDEDCYDSVKKLACEIVKIWKSGSGVVCLGGAEFAISVKTEILKIMNG